MLECALCLSSAALDGDILSPGLSRALAIFDDNESELHADMRVVNAGSIEDAGTDKDIWPARAVALNKSEAFRLYPSG